MKRRDFLKVVPAVIIGAGFVPQSLAGIVRTAPAKPLGNYDDSIKDYLHKMQNFDDPHHGDVSLDSKQLPLLESSVNRLKRLQAIVGHGNFHLLSFGQGLRVARNYSRVGPFSKAELDFLEMVFYENAALYGFDGEKPLQQITGSINRRDVTKIPHTGNYVYKGPSLEIYQRIVRDLGDQVTLTSGVRSVAKQFLLFLSKAWRSNGNFSLASRSLAPPGYSFHSVGDFDVGQVGFGPANFTERFTTTEVCRRLENLGYIDLRYRQDNTLGVRFEPWHIKVTPNATLG
jgi:hypothetical protein